MNSPEDANYLELQTTLKSVIEDFEGQISAAQPEHPVEESAPPAPSPAASEQPKWSKENHPAFKAGYKRPGAVPDPVEVPQAPTKLNVNDTVMAKWVSGDRQFYPARITSITGSSAAPVYTVTFQSYNNSETLRGNDVRPISNESKKRKADGPPPPSVSTSQTPGVISAAADINPDLVEQARKEPSKVSDGPTRPLMAPRKVKAKKELEAGKSKWQEFSTKGKASKVGKKESMFRTGDSYTARGKSFENTRLSRYVADIDVVGFTGSGTSMRKDPTRSRHVYNKALDEQ